MTDDQQQAGPPDEVDPDEVGPDEAGPSRPGKSAWLLLLLLCVVHGQGRLARANSLSGRFALRFQGAHIAAAFIGHHSVCDTG